MIENYIPSGEYGAKVAAILKPYENNLYAVGSNGRNKAYDLKIDVGGYDFVLDESDGRTGIVDDLIEGFADKVSVDVKEPVVNCDCETFNLKLRIQSLGRFLRQVSFAGDMLAVSVKDGALICCPEFMTVPPMIQVRPIDKHNAQSDKEWQDKHVLVLKKFHDDIVEKISKANEPATS